MSVSKWREREREQRRQDIIESAEKMFFLEGYDNVSMNDIAKEVGFSKATLYLYFEKKEELFFAIVLKGVQILDKIIEEQMGKEKKGIDKVLAFNNAYTKYINEYSDYFRAYNYLQSGRFDLTDILNSDYIKKIIENGRLSAVLPSSITSSEPSASEYIQNIFQLRKKMFILLTNSIDNGIKEGSIRSDIYPMELAFLLVLINENMGNLRPDIKVILESQGIDQDHFVSNVENSLKNMIKKS